MNKYLLLIALAALFSCRSKKTSMGENDDAVNISDFIGFFQPLSLPYQVTDTIFNRKDPETSLIHPRIFGRMVPDSVVSKYFGKEGEPRFYAVGKVGVPKAETYLFVKATAHDRKLLYILCYDKGEKFIAARPVLYWDNESGVSGQASMDTKYTLTLTHQRRVRGGEMLYRKDAYVFNAETGLSLILTESNEGKDKPPAIYNPIDTFLRKHKYSGDYSQDRRNFISVRDGKDPSRILFFVHFEKMMEDGACKGELKGEARFISPTTARYRSYQDPCTIDFTFHPAGVAMKEQGGCGSHRDIKCFFEGFYDKGRASPPKTARKKT
jgi:hypothetical protein